MRDMEYNQIRCFLKVAELEHVSHTTAELGIFQPKLSKTIRVLEQELGCKLFDRNGRGIRLNDNGKIYPLSVLVPELLWCHLVFLLKGGGEAALAGKTYQAADAQDIHIGKAKIEKRLVQTLLNDIFLDRHSHFLLKEPGQIIRVIPNLRSHIGKYDFFPYIFPDIFHHGTDRFGKMLMLPIGSYQVNESIP